MINWAWSPNPLNETMEKRLPGSDSLPEPSLKKMFILSLLFHVLIFSAAFVLPQPYSPPRPFGEIIEVDLVELPRRAPSKARKSASKPASQKKVKAKKVLKTKKPGVLKVKKKPVVIAKKVVKKREKKKSARVQEGKLLEQALKKIERKVKKEEAREPDRVEEAVSRLSSRARPGAETGKQGRPLGAAGGIAIEIYKAEIESRIKENWAYPVALVGPDASKELEATVILTVKRTGEILKWEFKKKSGNAIFDQSVIKAVERSNPLPPFPEGYIRSFDEIEINFNLRELQG